MCCLRMRVRIHQPLGCTRMCCNRGCEFQKLLWPLLHDEADNEQVLQRTELIRAC